ncbi:unnamed protein product [Toxocara canis]|uniref:KH domain-containing protein n=1 Tax=Toxocara canis TaxID=6265 RepID=A0A183VES9_TOXCA|nr:unnamed protein product [Toxocara canis]
MNVADGRSAETTTSPTIPTTEMGNLGMDESAGRLGSMSDSVTDTIDIPGLCVGLALLQFSFYHSPAQKFDDGVLAHRGGLKRAPHKRDLEMEKNSMLQRSLGRTELAVMFQVHKSILAMIGHGGEQIQRIQSQSNCHVQICPNTHGSGRRQCTIQGNKKGVARAKLMIQQVVGLWSKFSRHCETGQSFAFVELMNRSE